MVQPVLKVLELMKLKPKELIKPDLTVEFYEDIHRYYDLKQKHWVKYSVTEIASDSSYLNKVLKRDDNDPDKQKISESIKRGNAVHEAVEHWFKTGEVLDAGDYRAWVNQFINYPNLKGWTCLASELVLIDRRYNTAGKLDFLLEKDDRLVLCDLKTKNPKFTKDHVKVKSQLGGYVSILHHKYPTLNIDSCRVYWVTPEKCTADEYSTIDCVDLFTSARRQFRETQPSF